MTCGPLRTADLPYDDVEALEQLVGDRGSVGGLDIVDSTGQPLRVFIVGPGVVVEDIRGNYHNPDGPAIVDPSAREWRTDGLRHRLDGPAMVWADGCHEWWIAGRLHREDAPALIHPNGTQQWWRDGFLHRLDGPAITWPNGTQEFWVEGEKVNPDDPELMLGGEPV